MMDILNDLVRNLVVLVIVMTFLEMLLPENKLRDFARLIFGLMIIATILNPIVVLLSNLGRVEFTEFAFGGELAMGHEDDITKEFNQRTFDQFLINVEEKVKDVVQPHIEGYSLEVYVEIVEDFDDENFGKILSLDIYMNKDYDGVKPIKTVVIGKDEHDKYIVFKDSGAIKKSLSDYFQVAQSTINVYVDREEG